MNSINDPNSTLSTGNIAKKIMILEEKKWNKVISDFNFVIDMNSR